MTTVELYINKMPVAFPQDKHPFLKRAWILLRTDMPYQCDKYSYDSWKQQVFLSVYNALELLLAKLSPYDLQQLPAEKGWRLSTLMKSIPEGTVPDTLLEHFRKNMDYIAFYGEPFNDYEYAPHVELMLQATRVATINLLEYIVSHNL